MAKRKLFLTFFKAANALPKEEKDAKAVVEPAFFGLRQRELRVLIVALCPLTERLIAYVTHH